MKAFLFNITFTSFKKKKCKFKKNYENNIALNNYLKTN